MTPPPFFWRDASLLQAEYAEHGSLRAVSFAHGIHERTLGYWWRKLGLPTLPRGPKPTDVRTVSDFDGLVRLVQE